MKQIRKITNPLIKSVEKVLNRALDNVYLNTAIKVFLILYAALAAPKFPPKLAFLMDNIFVRIGISFLIVFMAVRDPGIALMIAVAFIITLQTASKLRLMDGSLSQALPGQTSWLPSAKEGFYNANRIADIIEVMDDYADAVALAAADAADGATDAATIEDATATAANVAKEELLSILEEEGMVNVSENDFFDDLNQDPEWLSTESDTLKTTKVEEVLGALAL